EGDGVLGGRQGCQQWQGGHGQIGPLAQQRQGMFHAPVGDLEAGVDEDDIGHAAATPCAGPCTRGGRALVCGPAPAWVVAEGRVLLKPTPKVVFSTFPGLPQCRSLSRAFLLQLPDVSSTVSFQVCNDCQCSGTGRPRMSTKGEMFAGVTVALITPFRGG